MTIAWTNVIDALYRASGDDLRALDDTQLQRLESLLYHWQQLAAHEQKTRSVVVAEHVAEQEQRP